MKTRYKITIIILLIMGIPISSIMTIDYVYANTDTSQFTAVSKIFCPYFPISDDFVPDSLFFAVYYTDPIKQLDMIHYNFQSVCYNETEESPIDLDHESDQLNSKGCPQFCPKESTLLLESQFEEIKSNIEKTGYGICGIQLEGEKIIIHLNWIFEDSEYEQEILSKIPNDIDYEIIYYDDYVDFSPQTLREPHCDSLEIDDNNFPHVGEFVENEN